MFFQLAAAASLSVSGQVGPRMQPVGFVRPSSDSIVAADTIKKKRPRPHAIEYSDAYYTRLQIHRIASYAELPLFGAEYILGQRLLNEDRTGFPSPGLKTAHTTVAVGLGALFAVNTVTGVWNLWDSRADRAGKRLRLIHSALMLVADGGFALAGSSAGSAKNSTVDANHHRSIALTSMGIATAGTVIMWLFHD